MAIKQIQLSPIYQNWKKKSYPSSLTYPLTFQYDLGGVTISNARISYKVNIGPFWDPRESGYLDEDQIASLNQTIAIDAHVSGCTRFGQDFSAGSKRTRDYRVNGLTEVDISDNVTLSGSYSIQDGHYLQLKLEIEDSLAMDSDTSIYCQSAPLLTARAEIEDIDFSISPNPVEIGNEVALTFTNRKDHAVSIKLTSNSKTLDTYAYSGTSSGEDSYEITCDPSWFQTAGVSGVSMPITVEVTDNTNLNIPRTGTKTFTLQRDALGVEISAPAITGDDSYINFTFSERKGHDLYMKIQGAEKGKTSKVTLMAETNITSSISAEQYSVQAPDSWFTNINGNEMDVYVTVTDRTWGRVWPSDGKANFTLRAGAGAKPDIKSIELTSHIYPEKYASVLTNAGYNGFVSGYSQIVVTARIKATLGAQMSSAVARFNGYDTTLTNKGADQNDASYFVYEGTTTRVISSASTATITITATDNRLRSTITDAYVNSNEIQQLKPISLRQNTVPTVGSKLDINPSDYVGSYNCTVKTNNFEVASATERTTAYTPNTTYTAYFQNTNQTGQAYINLQVYITDALDRSILGGYVTFRLNAPNPQFLSFTYENIADPRMPENDKSGNPYGVVSGFSKVRLLATVRWYYDDSTVTVAGGYGATGGTMTKGTGTNNEYGHEDINYTFETDGVIATSSASIEFTPTAKDTGKDSSRTGETVGTKLNIPVTRLADITISASPSGSVSAGSTITVTPSNFVGDYSYVFATSTKTELAKSDEPISDDTFTQECSYSWFTEAGVESGNLSVELTITDVLGRTNKTPFRFTVRLEDLTLQVTPTSLVFGNSVTIAIGGTAGQTITVAFTTPNLDGTTKQLYSFTTTSSTPDPVTCPKSWFTGFDNKKQLDITVTVSYGSGSNRKEKSLPFKLNYPDLGLAITKIVDLEEVTVTSATVGDNLNYTFSNLEGESVNINYYYVLQSRSLLQYGPYSEAQTIATPQLFDSANVTKSMTMQINIVISDARGRTATISNFVINASESMAPSITSFTLTPVNEGADERFQNSFISNFSKFIAVITVQRNSQAIIPASNVVLTIQSKKFPMINIGNNQFRYESTEPISSETLSGNVSVTDERGFGEGEFFNFSSRYYEYPTANISYHRCNQDKSANDIGDYCLLTCDYGFNGMWTSSMPPSALNQGEITVSTVGYTETVELEFFKNGALPPGMTPPKEDVPDHGTLEFLIPNMSIEQTYQITVTLTDLITSTSYTVTLSTGGAIMDFFRGGKGVAIGKVAEHSTMLEVNPNWELKASVKINGQLYDLATLLSQIKQQLGI